jgi:hypothetical protein
MTSQILIRHRHLRFRNHNTQQSTSSIRVSITNTAHIISTVGGSKTKSLFAEGPPIPSPSSPTKTRHPLRTHKTAVPLPTSSSRKTTCSIPHRIILHRIMLSRSTAVLRFVARERAFSAAAPSSESLAALYLHIGPSGDCWTGSSIYAAKHLQPGYVKSILLPPHTDAEALLERLDEQPKTSQQIYDDGVLPAGLLESLKDERDG